MPRSSVRTTALRGVATTTMSACEWGQPQGSAVTPFAVAEAWAFCWLDRCDPTDARTDAVVALCTKGLREVVIDDAPIAIRLMGERRHDRPAARESGRTRRQLARRDGQQLPGIDRNTDAGGPDRALACRQQRRPMCTLLGLTRTEPHPP